jgi:hypothetical protein
MAAASTVIPQTPLPIPGIHLGLIPIALFTKHADRPPVPLDLMLLIPKSIEDMLQGLPVFQGLANSRSIPGRPVSRCLIDILRVYAYLRKQGFHIHLMMPGIACIPFPGIRYHSNGKTEVPFELFLFGHILRHFSEHIVIIPGIDEPHLLTLVPQGPDHEVYGDNFPEITDMYGPGRGYPRRAGITPFLALFPDYLPCGLIGPMPVLLIHTARFFLFCDVLERFSIYKEPVYG